MISRVCDMEKPDPGKGVKAALVSRLSDVERPHPIHGSKSESPPLTEEPGEVGTYVEDALRQPTEAKPRSGDGETCIKELYQACWPKINERLRVVERTQRSEAAGKRSPGCFPIRGAYHMMMNRRLESKLDQKEAELERKRVETIGSFMTEPTGRTEEVSPEALLASWRGMDPQG